MRYIVVCVKAVPDPKEEGHTEIDPVSRNLIRGDVPLVLNPLDKNAIEAALQLKAHMEAHHYSNQHGAIPGREHREGVSGPGG